MFEVETAKLKVDSPLRYDLTTVSGQLLAVAGAKITAEIKDGWIEQGITRVCSTNWATDNADDRSLRPYDQEMLERLEANIENASATTVELSEKVARGESIQEQKLRRVTEDFLTDVDLDVAAVLAAAFGRNPVENSEDDQAIARRSSQMSILSMVVATELNYSEADRHTIGLSGLLHDISLMPMTRHSVESIRGILPFGHLFLDHPAASAHLLESILGLNPKICMAVAQVHEQPNGGGFPRGLQAHRIMPLARVLSMSDAYLTLVSSWQPEPFPKAGNFHPCDAIAYLMHHVSRGRFDADAVKALVRSNSLYPIGSQVQLSDNSIATVMRSTVTEPRKPIVRIDSERARYLDLRSTHLTIIRPYDDPTSPRQRISRKGLDEVLFR
jgi:HD-GYP domain-containing protein (c-di-GMP phosphodiesterase class II)